MRQHTNATGGVLFPHAPSTVVELLRFRAHEQPLQTAYTLLRDGETQEQSITYAQLDQRARAMAVQLQSVGKEGDRVLLLLPQGLEYIASFFGCLYAGMIAVPLYPPRPNRSFSRLYTIQGDARATVAVTTSQIRSLMRRRVSSESELKDVQWVIADHVTSDPTDWRPPQLEKDTLAFLQYTSGSTGDPKGVMVSHGNLLHNERVIQQAFGHTAESVVVGWLPLYHDMGLIGNLLQPLYCGIPCVLMSPMAFLQRPLRWLSAISKYHATTSGGPNFAYDLCVRRISPEQRATLDLSAWSVAFNGAEPIHADTLDRFSQAFASCGFRREAWHPCYGLAEATLMVSGGLPRMEPVRCSLQKEALEQHQVVVASASQEEGARTVVSCGRALPEQHIAIVHPKLGRECLPGEIGEIWVSGPSVAQGYWNRSEDTEWVFLATLAEHGTGPFLRTGDLGFLHHDELFVTGRLKDLIIIRGRNHYPHDIERTVERSYQTVRPSGGAAFAIEAGEEEGLVIVQEVQPGQHIDAAPLLSAIRQAVTEEHDLQPYAIVLIRAGTIPKTSSGKIQRGYCRRQFLEEQLDIIAVWRGSPGEPGNEAESDRSPEESGDYSPQGITTWLIGQLAGLLGVASEEIDPCRPLTSLGLDSLQATDLSHRLECVLNISFPMSRFLEETSINQLAEQVSVAFTKTQATQVNTCSSTAEESEGNLSYGQKALWFEHVLVPDQALYNIVSASYLRGDIDCDALHRAFQRIVDRHASLRTTFLSRTRKPVRLIAPSQAVALYMLSADGWGDATLLERLMAEAYRPFDLERGPLMRVHLFTRLFQDPVLLFVVHHMVADLWSLELLLYELGLLYQAEVSPGNEEALPAPSLDYGEYVRGQDAFLQSQDGERQLRYWQQQLAGDLPVLNMPTDRPYPVVPTAQGASHNVRLGVALTGKLKALGQHAGTTLFMTLLAAFAGLLSRYTEQDDVIVGAPTAGRDRADLANLVGYCVNPVALRIDLSGNPTVNTLLNRIRETVLGALSHQAYPFAALVDRLQLQRDGSRVPLFHAWFVLQQGRLLRNGGIGLVAAGEEGTAITVGGLVLEPIALPERRVPFDLTMMSAEVENDLVVSLQYRTDLFEATTIHRMAEHFRAICEAMVANPHERLADLGLLAQEERQQVLKDWNDTAAPWTRPDTLHELVEAQVVRTPEAIAVVCGEHQLTYRLLNQRANLLAKELRQRGVGPDVRVGLYLERSVELVVGILGILKAGGAYVPIDPAFPAERQSMAMADAQVVCVVTHERLRQQLSLNKVQVVCVEEIIAVGASEYDTHIDCHVSGDNLAYVIYTSGSTGRPKGVAVTHANVVQSTVARHRYYGNPVRSFLLLSSVSFDSSVAGLFWTLSQGGRLVIPSAGPGFNPDEVRMLMQQQAVTHVLAIPALWKQFLILAEVKEWAALQVVIVAGESCSQDLVACHRTRVPEVALYNEYGPTEATVWSTVAACTGRDKEVTVAVPIGRPIPNTQVYVLDQSLHPVPIGVPGELYIGGGSIARGYWNQPELTAERFVPDPFSEQPGRRLYSTGDRVRWRGEGWLEFLGRRDEQVKIRGYRIELGEIEARLRSHVGVRDAAVLVQEEPATGKQLVAYLAVDQAQGSTENELRQRLKVWMPDYMVPTKWIMIDTLPRTPNGKVDRKALSCLEKIQTGNAKDADGPRTPLEGAIATVWQEVLGLQQVFIHDNFFELGGHSLLGIQVIGRLEELYGVKLPLARLFETPTVAGIAQGVVFHLAEQSDGQLMIQLLDELEQLPEEEADQLLAVQSKEGNQDVLSTNVSSC